MWLFKPKKEPIEPTQTDHSCPRCQSTHTSKKISPDGSQADQIKFWRGKRYNTFVCLDCSCEFYEDEPAEQLIENASATSDDDQIDEATLNAAEDELRKQTDEDDDHMCH